MPPRVSVRRIFLCVLLCGGALVLLTLNQKLLWVNEEGPKIPPARFYPVRPLPPAQPSGEDTEHTEEPSQPSQESKSGKAWFFTGGDVYPERTDNRPALFPEESSDDRIIEQLMYVPEDYQGIIDVMCILLLSFCLYYANLTVVLPKQMSV